MTPEQLKASILQYAIQGKLVDQRPEEGASEDLYKGIQAEKTSLIKSGTIKKEKPLAPISEDEIPFDIPESWKWCRLGALTYNWGQKTPDNRFCYVDVGSVNNISHTLNSENTVVEAKDASSRAKKIVKYGDVIFATIRPYLKNICIIDREFPYEPIVSTAFAVMHCPEGLLNKYLYYYLLSPTFMSFANARDKAKGVAYPAIGEKDFFNGIVALPPIEEQQRIVAKIEKLLPYVDRYAAAYEKLEQFNAKFPEDMKKSILQYAIQGKLVEQKPEEGTGAELYKQMQAEKQRLIKEKKSKKEKTLVEITDDEIPFDIPETWIWIRVGDVGSWGSGATPPRTYPAYYGGSIPWLKTGDLNDGFIKEVPEFITELALEKTSVRLNPVGSVLMAMYGATIGKLGILEIPATTNQACCACIPYAGMYNKYLFYYLMSMRQTYIGMAEGGAQPNISKEKIVNSILPLPPLEEQHRIVAKLEEILPLCERLK